MIVKSTMGFYIYYYNKKVYLQSYISKSKTT